MTDHVDDVVEFDELVALALAEASSGPAPRPIVKTRLMTRIENPSAAAQSADPDLSAGARSAVSDLSAGARSAKADPLPDGFSLRFAPEDDWVPHPVPGIRMKVLSVNRRSGYATLLLDVQPGTRFPAHHHDGDEECYVISGSVYTLGRRLGPGDFVHADAGTDHGELWTDEGARVLLVVQPEDYMRS